MFMNSSLSHSPLKTVLFFFFFSLLELPPIAMPPRKKTKRAHSTTPQAETAQSSADTPGSTDSVEKPEADYDMLTDPWTDEQETALLKAIIKWKPVGEFEYGMMRNPMTVELIRLIAFL